ncbi:MAG: FG-GAP repeat protein, partial [Anaerolineales bacterium]|nr:FG-GAP repeat protein [Anaerolineales bacterium]
IALAEMGYAVSTAGDINDDFYDDLIIGAPGYNGTGAALIFLGRPGGPAALPDRVLNGEQDASRFGHAVSTAGYVNDDFFADVIVGAPEYDGRWGADEGRAYVYYGNSAGVPASPDWIAETDEQFSSPGSLFGFSVDTAGDFDRNGFDDVVIGAPYFAPDGETGLVAVFPGSDVGLPGPIANLIDGFEDEADFGPSELGYAVAGAGDVDGDGFDDVIAGAPVFDVDFQAPGFEGAAYLYLGATERFSGTFTTYDTVILPSQLDSRFGHAVDGAGDVNRDGYDDLIIGAPQYDDTSVDDGAAFLYLGNTDFFWSGFDVGYFGDQSGSVFGTAVSTAGDANGDRYDDFVVGAPKQLTPISTVGQAFGFYGYGPIAGLTAVNNSPALKNEAVQFAATISAGG